MEIEIFEQTMLPTIENYISKRSKITTTQLSRDSSGQATSDNPKRYFAAMPAIPAIVGALSKVINAVSTHWLMGNWAPILLLSYEY